MKEETIQSNLSTKVSENTS